MHRTALQRDYKMKKFQDIIICTDLDGTLLRADKSITKENLDAITYFQSEGGYFTFITGRMPFFCYDIYHTLRPNAPVGCINGGGLFDYETGKYIHACTLDKRAGELIDYVLERMPHLGVQVNTLEHIYFHSENVVMEWFRKITGVPNLVKKWNEIEEDFAKIVFGVASEEDIPRLMELLASHPYAEQYDFIRSERTLYEILPKNVHKGTALLHLCEYLKIPMSKTVAIGDYNNDIGMIQSAGIGIAVGNAKPEVKAVADYVTVSNEESAIARVIDAIEKGEYTFQ